MNHINICHMTVSHIYMLCVSQLAGVCDVLVENYLPGKLQQMGLGYEQLSRVNPQIIYCSISGTDWLLFFSGGFETVRRLLVASFTHDGTFYRKRERCVQNVSWRKRRLVDFKTYCFAVQALIEDHRRLFSQFHLLTLSAAGFIKAIRAQTGRWVGTPVWFLLALMFRFVYRSHLNWYQDRYPAAPFQYCTHSVGFILRFRIYQRTVLVLRCCRGISDPASGWVLANVNQDKAQLSSSSAGSLTQMLSEIWRICSR